MARPEFALLTDRVRLAQGQPQVYGSQFANDDGVLRPMATVDWDTVDERRDDGVNSNDTYLGP